jgi:hypothetical protein
MAQRESRTVCNLHQNPWICGICGSNDCDLFVNLHEIFLRQKSANMYNAFLFLLQIVFLQKIEDMYVPTIEFFEYIAKCFGCNRNQTEAHGNFCLFIIFSLFLPFLIGGILSTGKSCDF